MTPKRGEDWTWDEHVLAFNLYCKTSFGSIGTRNPEIIRLAELMGRTVGAVSFKLANFARLDPEHQSRGVHGMPHGAKGEEAVWRAFNEEPEELAFESEKIRARFLGKTLEEIAGVPEDELPVEGLERERLVRMRVNQHFFRSTVLAAYDFACCITGLQVHELLVASHIVPWATNRKERMNPRNGLCLNALHDRAFDRGLLTIGPDYRVRFADGLTVSKVDDTGLKWLLNYAGSAIRLPKKFPPCNQLLAKHGQLCAEKWKFSGLYQC